MHCAAKKRENFNSAASVLQASLEHEFFHEKGDCVVLLMPSASCMAFTFVTFVSLCKGFVNLNKLQIASFTLFLPTMTLIAFISGFST